MLFFRQSDKLLINIYGPSQWDGPFSIVPMCILPCFFAFGRKNIKLFVERRSALFQLLLPEKAGIL